MEESQKSGETQQICPNCLEPNNEGLTNCSFCGMPLRPDAVSPDALPSNPEGQDFSDTAESANPVAALPVADGANPREQEPKEKKKGRGFTYAMRGMGIYLIVVSVTEIPRSFQLEDVQERRLSVLSNIIYLIAGCLMAWPLLKEYLDKRKEKQQDTFVENEPIEIAEPVSDPEKVIDLDPDSYKSVDDTQPQADSDAQTSSSDRSD